jgi:hypothetical protein
MSLRSLQISFVYLRLLGPDKESLHKYNKHTKVLYQSTLSEVSIRMRGKHTESGVVFVHRNRHVEEMPNRSLDAIYNIKNLQIISVYLQPTISSIWDGYCFHSITKRDGGHEHSRRGEN